MAQNSENNPWKRANESTQHKATSPIARCSVTEQRHSVAASHRSLGPARPVHALWPGLWAGVWSGAAGPAAAGFLLTAMLAFHSAAGPDRGRWPSSGGWWERSCGIRRLALPGLEFSLSSLAALAEARLWPIAAKQAAQSLGALWWAAARRRPPAAAGRANGLLPAPESLELNALEGAGDARCGDDGGRSRNLAAPRR